MEHKDAAILLIEVHKNQCVGFKLTTKDQSVINNIVLRLQDRRLISNKQSWALQEIYRRSTGHGKKIYSRIV